MEYSQKTEKEQTKKAAIIGLGVIGTVHLRILQNLGIHVVALCDIDKQKLSQFENQNITLYDDYKLMLEENNIDIVHICTPHYLHAEMVIFALEKNINVLCEKPLCINEDEINCILQAEKNSKAILGVVHQNRYNAQNQYIKEFLKDKSIVAAHGSVVWSRDKDYYLSSKWRGKKKTEGGGAIINQAIHTLDLLEWFCGKPEFVTASTDNYSLKDVIEVEDTASAVFEGDSNFTFFTTNTSKRNMPVEITLMTVNETIKIFGKYVLINDKAILFDGSIKNLSKGYYGNGHESLINDFYDCVNFDKHFWIDGKEASLVLKLIFAIYKSKGNKVMI